MRVGKPHTVDRSIEPVAYSLFIDQGLSFNLPLWSTSQGRLCGFRLGKKLTCTGLVVGASATARAISRILTLRFVDLTFDFTGEMGLVQVSQRQGGANEHRAPEV